MSTPLTDPPRLDQARRLLRPERALRKAVHQHEASRAVGGSEVSCPTEPITSQKAAQRSDLPSVETSYIVLRNGIGVLGFALPFVLVVGAGLDHVQGSLSAYYHFSPVHPAEYGAGTMRDVFVGLLCTIGAFLLFYRGHTLKEDVALNIAGISAVLIALFPMDWPAATGLAPTTSAKLHSWCATIFFVMLAYVCVFCARDTLNILADEKRRRNFERVYVTLGVMMLATPATIFALQYLQPYDQRNFATLLVEVVGVFVFAAFWLVKGWEIRSCLRRV